MLVRGIFLIKITGHGDTHHFRKRHHDSILSNYCMVMKNQKKLDTPLLTHQEQVTVKLLPYQRDKTTISPEQNASQKKKETPLFYNKPIYRVKKHDFL